MSSRAFDAHLVRGLGVCSSACFDTSQESSLPPSSEAPVAEPCCDDCAETGGSCGGKSAQFLPGQNSSFPVGFGQASTGTIAEDAVTGWAVPLTVGAVALLAGFGLAYVLVK
jgi:hypothetical protein